MYHNIEMSNRPRAESRRVSRFYAAATATSESCASCVGHGILLPATITGFPLGLENLEKWEGVFQSGKSRGIFNRLEKSGKITQNTGKMRKFQINIICYFFYDI